MSIRRVRLPFEEQYVQIPNAWMRDKRLSRRARGLLAEIMTHQAGWVISVASLWKNGTEGREAIRKAILELAECGYLQRDQTHGERGRFGEMNYVLASPTVTQKLDDGTFTGPRSTVAQDPATKNTIREEEHEEGGAAPTPFCDRHPHGTDQPCRACMQRRIAYDLTATPHTVSVNVNRAQWDPNIHCEHWQLRGSCDICDYEAKHAAGVLQVQFGGAA